VASYADVTYVLRHPELFSSRAMMSTMQSAMGVGLRRHRALAGRLARIGELVKTMPIPLGEGMRSRSLIGVDPPVHGPMRNLVNRGFTPRRIASLETRVRAIAKEAIAALEGKPDFDIVSEFFMPLPVTVIAELLGVEPERSADFKHWSDCAVAASTGGAGTLGPVRLLEGMSELTQYIIDVVERRRRQPQDDLISTLIGAEAGEAALTPSEVVMFTLLLLVAGNETTTNLLGNTLLALIEHPTSSRACGAIRRGFPRSSRRRCATTDRSSSCSARRPRTSSCPA
jgi:cytochrome P450